MRASILSPLVPRKGSMPAARNLCAKTGRKFTISTRAIMVYTSNGSADCKNLMRALYHSRPESDRFVQNRFLSFLCSTTKHTPIIRASPCSPIF